MTMINFNKGGMSVDDLKKCTEAFETALWVFKREEDVEEGREAVANIFEYYAKNFTIWREVEKNK
jgi:hypothetical protein